MDIEAHLQNKHYLEVLETAAEINQQQAFVGLQTARTASDQAHYSEEMEVWVGTQILLKQRKTLIEYAQTVLARPACGLAREALQTYLNEITGANLEEPQH